MTTQKSNNSFNETLPIVSLLQALGHTPLFIKEDEAYYTDILGKQANNKVVLLVNSQLNSWFDRLLGKGGNLMDFARNYWPDLSPEVIEERLHDIQYNITNAASKEDKPRRKRRATKIPHYKIDRTRPLGYRSEITDFLKENGLWELADLNIQEVYYFVIDQKGKRKDFCAAGWQNENRGWEVRAEHFESCLGPKGMTFITASETLLAVFPDYVDYLKRRGDKHLHYASVLILNHADFLPASVKRAQHFEKVLFYVDETRDGYQSTKEAFTDKLPNAEVIPL